MLGLAPLAAAPLAALLLGGAVAPSGRVQVDDLPATDIVWLLEIAAPAADRTARPAPFGLAGGAPLGAADRPTDAPSAAPVVRVSDRGWIGEPDDADLPNVRYPERLQEPPALESTFPLYPSSARREARNTGEVLLLNGDGALDELAADWGLAGQPITLLRGPHRSPRRAPYAAFGRVASLRSAGAFGASGGRLRLPLTTAAADLSVPVCQTYAGTGGDEGPAALAGQSKPLLLGSRGNIQPVLEDAALQLFRFHHGGPAQAVTGARDRGMPYLLAGDYPSRAALSAVVLTGAECATCLSQGLLRTGSVPSLLTIDARGEAAGGYAGSAADIAQRLLRGPGGLGPDRAAAADFAAWPTGEVGLYLTGGSVADAMELLAARVFGVWGADAFGRFYGRVLLTPEELGVSQVIEPWMLAAPPQESEAPSPPWYRATVGYAALERVQVGADLAEAVGAGDRDLYGRAYQPIVAEDFAVRAAYPAAVDGGEVVTGFRVAGEAQPIADRLLRLFARPRRSWTAPLRPVGGMAWSAIETGTCVQLTWPGDAALRQGRPLIVRAKSIRGDAVTLDLWG